MGLHRTFSTGEVIAAAGITNAALQTWINRGKIVGDGAGVDMPGKPGIRRVFSFYQLMQIATAAALIRDGAGVSDAFNAAQQFSHCGDQTRRAGFPFPGGLGTILAVSGDRSEVLPWQRSGVDPYRAAHTALGHPISIRMLDLNQVFQRALTTLEEGGWARKPPARTPGDDQGIVDGL